MKSRIGYLVYILILCASSLPAQQDIISTPTGSTPADILLKQAQTKQDQQSSSQTLNERMKFMVRIPKTITDYLLGPGDVIEITVVGIPGLEKKQFTLDGQGNIFVPYVGQVELLGLKLREAETRLAQLFSVSLLEDPQVTIGIKEYRSQYYYVVGAVKQTGKFPLTQSMDILDSLVIAGGLTEKANSTIKIYRNPQQQASETPDSKLTSENALFQNPAPAPLEISLTALLAKEQTADRVPLYPGDVVEVPERQEKTYYVLGDIPKPGAFAIDASKRMNLSLALANAGGMLRTASGHKVVIIRQKDSGVLPEQIKVNAYSVLKGSTRDVDLCENDIVLVPGSSSKTLGKNFLSGVSSLLGALFLLGTR